MSEVVHINIDTAELEEKVKVLSHVKLGAEKAVMRTLNRALVGMATDAGYEVPKTYIIKKREVMKHLEKKKATPKDLTAIMSSGGRPLRLTHFTTKPNKKPGVKGKPTAFAQVKKSSGGGRIRNPSAFTANFKAGGVSRNGIFARTGEFRRTSTGALSEGMRQLYGPGKVQMLDNPEIREIIQKRAVQRFNARIDHEIGYLLSKTVK